MAVKAVEYDLQHFPFSLTHSVSAREHLLLRSFIQVFVTLLYFNAIKVITMGADSGQG